jgi:hypothetical protein
MSVIERIKVLAEKEGSVRKFAEKCGVNERTLSNAIQRGSELKENTIQSIVNAYPNLNLYWLLLGEGDMWNDTLTRQLMEERAQYVTRLNELLEQRVKELERELKKTDPARARDLGIE